MIDDSPIRPKQKRSWKDFEIDRLKKGVAKWKKEAGKWRLLTSKWQLISNNSQTKANKRVQNIEKSLSKVQHIEMMMRAIIAYQKLSKEGIFSIREFAILATGSHTEVFTNKDIRARYEWGWITRDLNSLIRAGYVKAMKRGRYYLTPEGKKRMNDIMDYIYNERRIKYRIAVRRNKDDSKQGDVPALTDITQGQPPVD